MKNEDFGFDRFRLSGQRRAKFPVQADDTLEGYARTSQLQDTAPPEAITYRRNIMKVSFGPELKSGQASEKPPAIEPPITHKRQDDFSGMLRRGRKNPCSQHLQDKSGVAQFSQSLGPAAHAIVNIQLGRSDDDSRKIAGRSRRGQVAIKRQIAIAVRNAFSHDGPILFSVTVFK